MKIDELLKDFGYGIVDTYQYQWQCYGENAHGYEWNNGVSAIFDLQTGDVCEISVWPEGNTDNDAYRWVNPQFEIAYIKEGKDRMCYQDLDKMVFSHVSIMTMCRQAFANQEIDTDLVNYIDFQLSSEQHALLMAACEIKGVTLDEFVNEALRQFIEEHEETKNGDTP